MNMLISEFKRFTRKKNIFCFEYIGHNAIFISFRDFDLTRNIRIVFSNTFLSSPQFA